MKIYKCILIVSCLICLTGCGKDKVDYVTETNTPTDGVVTNMSNKSLKEQIGAGERWESDIDSTKGKKINAEIIIPNLNGMKVVNLERANFDAEFKGEFIESITSETVYKYDDEYIPKEEIEKNIEYYKTVLAELESQGIDPYKEESEHYGLYQGLLAEEERLKTAPSEYVSADDYSNNTFLLVYNEREYILGFWGAEAIDKKITFCLKEPTDIFEENYVSVIFDYTGDYTPASDDDTEVNRCNITEEEAKTVALDFVNQFGLGDFKIVNSNDLSIYATFSNGSSETFKDGYSFTLYRCIDDIAVDGNKYKGSSDIMWQYLDTLTNYEAFNSNYCFEEINICVTDEGVVEMTYISPFCFKETVAENVNLLSFDSVKNIIIDQINSSTYFEHETFESMELGYYNYWSEDYNNTVVIPVWKLTTYVIGDGLSINSAILINAMDGSVIDVGKQQYQNYNLMEEETADEVIIEE